MRFAALLCVCFLSSCASSTVISRGDWVRTFDRYDSKPDEGGTIWSPAPGAVEMIVTKKQRDELYAKLGMPSMLEGRLRLPSLLRENGPVRVREGEITAFDEQGDVIRSMRLSGSAAEVFWTVPRRFSQAKANGSIVSGETAEIYLRGNAPGEAFIELELTDGSARRVRVEVTSR